jgi:2-polyprenyl-3-methyl-5-hydroxy-6-metoxy-1,4-benzoquinol methylase
MNASGIKSSPVRRKRDDGLRVMWKHHCLRIYYSRRVPIGKVHRVRPDLYRKLPTEETPYADGDYFTRKNRYVARWDEFYGMFEFLVDKIARFKQGGAFLDVGAGVGTLMYAAGKKGFAVTGVEISPWASLFAREEKGLNVMTGSLEDMNLLTESFDVVVLNHVLEHVDRPRNLLSEVKRLLKKDGLLVIGVPNIGSLMARIKKSAWASLRPEEHIWHFTPTTLRRLLDDIGFREIYFEAKDNYPVQGWGPFKLFRRIVNGIAEASNRSEAMLLFAEKNNNV